MLGRLDFTLLGPKVEYPVPTINEGEALKVTVRPLSADLAATTPTSMRYRIDDVIQGNAVLDWTTLTPGTSVSFIVTSARNAMRNGCSKERRQIVVEAVDSDGPIRRTIDYDIADIEGIE